MSPKVTEEHKEQRRQEILQAARVVFKRKGFEAASMQDVIEESGMSRGGVYAYFAGKDDLFEAVLEKGDEKSRAHFWETVEKLPTKWAVLVTLLQDQEESLQDFSDSLVPATLEYSLSVRRGGSRAEFQRLRYKRVIDMFTRFLQEGVDQGEFAPLQPVSVIARHIITVLDGMVIHAHYLDPHVSQMTGQIEAFRMSLKQLLQVRDP